MRIKTEPDGFRVEEILRTRLRDRGSHAVYRIEKVGITTEDARDRIAAALGIPPAQVRAPARKDRLSRSFQHVSVPAGPGRRPASFPAPGVHARLTGFLDRHLDPRDLAGNRFLITIRDLDPEDAAKLEARLAAVAAEGLPNYFDVQRFGSFAPGLGFPGRLLLDKRWEDALRVFLVEPQLGDDPGAAAEKAAIRPHWGDFAAAFAAAPRSHRRSLLAYLKDHPAAFRQAIDRVRPDLLSLWLSAYQSHLWNRIAGRFIGEAARRAGVPTRDFVLPDGAALPLPGGDARPVADACRDLVLPLPHHRPERIPDELGSVWRDVLAEDGLEPRNLKARGLERAWLGRGRRALWVRPAEATAVESGPDLDFPGRLRATVAFELPPGSYATLVLRSLEKT